ncbi:hypothetical protein WICPIJ_004177 [Wickerhamomyces pijperi]|uniref:Uncharacterized protein n=1 Tax=Wickerhamomyces pijperi TaxID=599730 RepID=A0A9P8Q8J0_WICPI|nr:hypothetical protein WICPIJ_004177 [Wickerhamomyces pijperi]
MKIPVEKLCSVMWMMKAFMVLIPTEGSSQNSTQIGPLDGNFSAKAGSGLAWKFNLFLATLPKESNFSALNCSKDMSISSCVMRYPLSLTISLTVFSVLHKRDVVLVSSSDS